MNWRNLKLQAHLRARISYPVEVAVAHIAKQLDVIEIQDLNAEVLIVAILMMALQWLWALALVAHAGRVEFPLGKQRLFPKLSVVISG